MSVKILYFVHGTTKDNEKGIATGQNQGELSELGIAQLKKLAKSTSKIKVDEVFCSDLKRAVDSAQLIFGKKHKAIPDARLREIDYGKFTGKPSKEFKQNPEQFIEKPFTNGESYKDVEQRIANFIEFLKKNYSEKTVAIVAHQAPQLSLEVLGNRKSWEQAIAEDWRNTKSWKPFWEYLVE